MESEVEKQVTGRPGKPYEPGKPFRFHSKVNRKLRKGFKPREGSHATAVRRRELTGAWVGVVTVSYVTAWASRCPWSQGYVGRPEKTKERQIRLITVPAEQEQKRTSGTRRQGDGRRALALAGLWAPGGGEEGPRYVGTGGVEKKRGAGRWQLASRPTAGS